MNAFTLNVLCSIATSVIVVGVSNVAFALPNASRPLLISQASDPNLLQLDDSGNAVAGLQTQLTSLGYYQGPIDGIFGPSTEAGVIQFQTENGLIPDGVVGAETRAALQRILDQRAQPAASQAVTSQAATASPLLLLNDQGSRVAALQTQLRALNYYTGPISGVFDPLTEAAVIRFQTVNGLIPDGIVGPQTQATLDRNLAIAAPQTVPVLPNPAPITSQPSSLPPQAVSLSTPPATSPSTTLLRRGDTGTQVANLQQRLRELGFYNGPLSGTYDIPTEEAVTNFQRSRGLVVDGIAGPQTITALGLTSVPTTQGGRFSVLELQRRLQDRGLYSGPLNGVLGPETRTAIQAAQRQFNLNESDILNGRF